MVLLLFVQDKRDKKELKNSGIAKPTDAFSPPSENRGRRHGEGNTASDPEIESVFPMAFSIFKVFVELINSFSKA